MVEHYLGLKEFADRANERGLKISMGTLSVYKSRGTLPEPKVMIGNKAGWTLDQVDKWIDQKISSK